MLFLAGLVEFLLNAWLELNSVKDLKQCLCSSLELLFCMVPWFFALKISAILASPNFYVCLFISVRQLVLLFFFFYLCRHVELSFREKTEMVIELFLFVSLLSGVTFLLHFMYFMQFSSCFCRKADLVPYTSIWEGVLFIKWKINT